VNSFSRLIAATLFAAGLMGTARVEAAGTNTKIGTHALQGNIGSDETAIGFEAMDPNGQCTGPATPNACCTSAGHGTCGNSGTSNTAVGSDALQANTTGSANTATGSGALQFNTAGVQNTATGSFALQSNTTGFGNTAVGNGALQANTDGFGNTAAGASSLQSNTTGFSNTAAGDFALFANTSGNNNMAAGTDALTSNTTGFFNTAVGVEALQSNSTGFGNTAVGFQALQASTGNDNTAVGHLSLYGSTGLGNIGIGDGAGYNLTMGGANIDIGNLGDSADDEVIRIGVQGTQTATFMAGIRNGIGDGSGVAVYVDSSGQLSPTVSSARYKDDIRDMGDSTKGLMKLRPVRFRYKKGIDPSGLEQYGLVAEEVAKVYPDLVVYDDDGRPRMVRYHFVNAMLLNEVQRQQRELGAQRRQIKALQQQLDARVHDAEQQVEMRIDAVTTRLMDLEAAVHDQEVRPLAEAHHRARSGF
jgi:hypothetical protein